MNFTKSIILTAALLFGAVGYGQENGNETSEPDLAINTPNYHTAIGLRAGGTSGLTIKQFLGKRSALEGIFGAWRYGFSATLLYERHVPAFNVSGLSWYYGGGGHAVFRTAQRIYFYRGYRYEYYDNEEFGLGVDGVVGLEYKIPPIPLAVSLDLKPFLEVVSSGNVWMSMDPGLSLKFAF